MSRIALAGCALLCAALVAWFAAPPLARTAQRAGQQALAPADDDAGFEPIFDGKTLEGWDGDPAFWRVENGAIVAESKPEKPVAQNTFLIWRGGVLRDFELKLEYRLSDAANSGVQYRSQRVPGAGPWAMKGYQADMDGRDTYTGMVFEERGRGFLAPRGQFTRITPGGVRKLIGVTGQPEELRAELKTGDWNRMHIIARGNLLLHVVNGRLMAALIDEDSQGRSLDGLLGLQLHAGKPMRIEFRNLRLRRL
ncbi:MAG: 3-keto-disaccharide hydrolase [Bryobacteraceae bacterium]